MKCSRSRASPTRARSGTRQPAKWWSHDRRHHRPVHLHAGGVHRLRGDRARPGDPAHATDVGLEFRARHRAGGGDGRARTGELDARHGDRLHRRGAGGRQRRRRLRRHRAHAGNVQGERGEEAMTSPLSPQLAALLVNASYLLTAFLFIMGLKRMSSPRTAKSGVVWAGWGMLVATLITFLAPQIAGNYLLIV